MASQFSFTPRADGGEFVLSRRRGFSRRPVALKDWGEVEGTLRPAVRHLLRLADELDVPFEQPKLFLPSDRLCEIPETVAGQCGLPPVSDLVLDISLKNRVESPDGELGIKWRDASFRTVIPKIEGVVASTASGRFRLTSPIYRILSAVSTYNASKGQIPELRVVAWQPVQREIVGLAGEGVQVDAILRQFSIYQAGAFALDARESSDGPVFDPILLAPERRRSLADNAPVSGGEVEEGELPDEAALALLSPALHHQFVDSFNRTQMGTRPSYVLGRGKYLVLEPDLQRALDVVQRIRAESVETRRAFLRNPRSFIAAAFPDADDETGTIFVETRQYSDRVEGLGIWEKPYLPWLTKQGSGWLPEGFVLEIDGQAVELDEARLEALAGAADQAAEQGADHFQFGKHRFSTAAVRRALETLRRHVEGKADDDRLQGDRDGDLQGASDKSVLLVKDNLEEEAYTAKLTVRPLAEPQVWPENVRSTAKQHQLEGFGWLVDAWKSGLPGVLLADDMGLGKTLQALAFLCWFRNNRRALHDKGRSFAGPILIVAPTALLQNWLKEAEIHLQPDALGACVNAFGSDLKRIRAPRGSETTPEDALDHDALRHADWILTTYETLATYHRAFARIAYPVAIFDEMQKIKAPDTINSHTAKTINADFVIGLTGTPIENRIEDLWCIMDRIFPGYLGDLKAFSRRYGDNDEDSLKALKSRLDQPQQTDAGDKPPVPRLMLRRMKSDHLKGLPDRTIISYPEDMPQAQAQAYEAVVAEAHGAAGQNEMLKIIHRLRGVSLHPHGALGIDIYDPSVRLDWVSASARVLRTIEILKDIQAKGEKVLVFIEDREVQGAMAAVIAEEFDLLSEPEIINGAMAGDKRQAVVDRFQRKPTGFDVLILSPKAAGIGLTITAANHVVHLSRWWNPAVEDQCNDRVYRIGQERPVFVHVPIARHPRFGDSSFDVKLDALLERKRTLSCDMLAPPVTEGDAEYLYQTTAGSVGK